MFYHIIYYYKKIGPFLIHGIRWAKQIIFLKKSGKNLNYIMKLLKKALLNIFIFYFGIIVFMVLFLELLKYYPLMMNIVITIILIIGIIIDSRFNWLRKLLVIILLLVQYIIYIYIDNISILVIYIIFNYLLILNLAFIVHILVLPWLFKIGRVFNCEWLTFLVSRLSILISLTWITWWIESLQIIWVRFKLYREMLEAESKIAAEDVIKYGSSLLEWQSYCLKLLKDEWIMKKINNNKILKILFNFVFYILKWLRHMCYIFQIIFYKYCVLILNITSEKPTFFFKKRSNSFRIKEWKAQKWITNKSFIYNVCCNIISKMKYYKNKFHFTYEYGIYDGYERDISLYVEGYLYSYWSLCTPWRKIEYETVFDLYRINLYDFLYFFIYFKNYRLLGAFHELYIGHSSYDYKFSLTEYNRLIVLRKVAISYKDFIELYTELTKKNLGSILRFSIFPLFYRGWVYAKSRNSKEFKVYNDLTIWKFVFWPRKFFLFEEWDTISSKIMYKKK
jgi:hypothetical protein